MIERRDMRARHCRDGLRGGGGISVVDMGEHVGQMFERKPQKSRGTKLLFLGLIP
jgi:hypothetical protein